jgi:outer membrane protein OmpA-like peptidoglycan-associated protein
VKVLKLDSNFATLPEPEVPSFTARPLPGILLPRAIHFATGQIEIDSVSARVLEPVVSYLTEKDSVNVAIVGTADVSGSDVYNKLLSLRRAVAVKAYLEGYGIEGTRILVSGIGETGPEGEADTIRSRAYNRRAIFLLYGAHDAVLVDQDRDLKGIENQPSIAEEKR